MSKQKCPYTNQCPVFSGELKQEEKPLFLYHNVFCLAGPKGWNACKRFNLYELDVDPGLTILPENNDLIEDLAIKLRNNDPPK